MINISIQAALTIVFIAFCCSLAYHFFRSPKNQYPFTEHPDPERNDRRIIINPSHFFPGASYPDITARPVLIYLPPSYNKNSSRRYPVLYMQDEQNIWDYGEPGRWRVDTIADEMSRKSLIEEVIIVGIPNNPDNREREFFPPYNHIQIPSSEKSILQGWGDQYSRFVIQIKLFLDAHFRTKPDKTDTAIAGSSCGGIISWYMAYTHPELFGKVGIFSPAFHISFSDQKSGERMTLVTFMARQGEKKTIQIYMSCGGEGHGEDLLSDCSGPTVQMRDVLIEKGWSLNRDLSFNLQWQAPHNEHTWNDAFPAFLAYTFPRSQPQ
jgi:predicted alpha/beta superfamily hydrolase